ncbi:Cystinosin [Smittium mucronatum]|uniref:Cystinosin n=1 Tax=Smittium mucronatum TaxID=133383 RepID=A0A1R0GTZ0_9FUNG|nr:Cystinosin [Smittium mucronatum]OLY80364.1 Cystinosin [Smittium mucronatum]
MYFNPNYSNPTTALEVVSFILGWSYFLAWSVSAYPQIILNYTRKSVVGLSIDFAYLSTLGFFFYSLYNLGFYFFDSIKAQYYAANHSPVLIMLNDVFFSLHALITCLVVIYQCCIYTRSPSQNLSKPALAFIYGSISIAALAFIFAPLYKALIISSYFKLILTITKYIPQVYTNYTRKSTEGWSVHNVLLDFTGGIFSISQLAVDSIIAGNILLMFDNPGKMFLSLISIAFDLVFIVQHYVLYRFPVDYSFVNPPRRNSNDPITSSSMV